uniref:Uncharacterized protein n=1 Tax=Oryza punctata TaxID=4537 RepID=A0A0E0K5J4_ORYPU
MNKHAVQGESDFMLPLETLDSLTMSRSGIRWAPTGEEGRYQNHLTDTRRVC